MGAGTTNEEAGTTNEEAGTTNEGAGMTNMRCATQTLKCHPGLDPGSMFEVPAKMDPGSGAGMTRLEPG